MRRLLPALFLFLLFPSLLPAQPYGNEWINYSQKYYKIKIVKEGIYRVDSTALANTGISLSNLDPRRLQLFARGQEQAIYIQGEADSAFNAGDFIEFYAKPNDGWLDSSMYISTPFLPNPYYSLYQDTAVYFLTWNNSTVNKRMVLETDTGFVSYTPDNYCFKESLKYYAGTYYAGQPDAAGGTDPQYTRAEGWFDAAITMGTVKTYSGFNTANVYASGPPALSRIVAVGASRDITQITDHHLLIEYKDIGGNWAQLKDTFFFGYELNRFVNQIPAAQLAASTDFRFNSIAETQYQSNRTAVSCIYLKYPHTFDLENAAQFSMIVPENTSQLKSYLLMSNFNSGSSTVRLYDLSNGKRVTVKPFGSTYKALVPNSGNEKKIFVTSDNQVMNISSLLPVAANASFTDYSLNGPDSAFIIVTHKTLMSEANNYKAYRSSIAGGSYQVVVADIEELYDQFSYGIMHHPLSLRGFADQALDKWPSRPRYLLIMGKSIHANEARWDVNSYTTTLVPSCGDPSSDNLFTAGLNGTIYQPAIPTGRIAAKTNNDIKIYLDKVKEYESAVPAEWMKNVLHFGGGTSSTEQAILKGYLNAYRDSISGLNYGAYVRSFFKTSSQPIQINLSDSLKKIIEGGVSLMTFFGHASGTGFDQSIDNPANYNNKGKYSFLLANSCYAGDLHTNTLSSSELFVLLQDKGVIGYLSDVGSGAPAALDLYSREFYRNLGRKMYGQSVGLNIQEVVRVNQAFSANPVVKANILGMTLHGDPSIVINSFNKPDYTISNPDVFFDTESDVDSFKVFAVATNIAKATNDSIITELIRKFPNGDTSVYLKKSRAPFFKDTLVFTLPVDFVKGIGLNKFKVTLDLYGQVPELSELNNSTVPDVDLFLSGGTIIPVYPYKYAIIPNNTVTLKASTADPFAAATDYLFQIDTTDTFKNPLASTVISSPGGVVTWNPPITLLDSVVYYWRCSPKPQFTKAAFKWRESSFQYISGKRGWAQAHFFQFKDDGYQFVKFNRAQRRFDFYNDIKNIEVNNGVYPNINWFDIWYKINSYVEHIWTCAPNGFSFAVIDPISGNPLQSVYMTDIGFPIGQFGNLHCDITRPLNAFDYYLDDNSYWRPAVKKFIDTIPAGYYVLAYSQRNNYLNWSGDTTLYSYFDKLGSGKVRTVTDTVPYILWGKKGAAKGTAKEVIGSSQQSLLYFTDTFTTKWKEGYIASEVIGPAAGWGSLHWKQHTLDGSSTKDSVVVRLIGIKANGTESTLANFAQGTYDILNLSTYADATVYPKIRLVAYMKDDSLTTPPQMDKWQVYYTPVPEAALNPKIAYSFYKDTLQEGDDIKLVLGVQNISEFDFTDSLQVNYWIEDKNRVKTLLPYSLKNPPFVAGASFADTLQVNTTGFPGANALWLEVNPVGIANSQLEQYHFNNIAKLDFYAISDKINPLLDVTFDGIHILNNDIVSARPNILVQLKDENKFLALNDTSDFSVFLKKPSSSLLKQIYFGADMSFTPAVLPNNSCKINYTPRLTEDGQYQLLVQAKDRSDNLSGTMDYKINFEVVNKSMITEVMNYPNPFSTSTRFVFTLTGSELPSYFKIQILTVTGKVIREIKSEELGPIHIGRNITEYAWDGKDEFGDKLANGVYLYRVQTGINGSPIDKMSSGADTYFTKGFGKMYIIR